MKKYILIFAVLLCTMVNAQTIQTESNLDLLISNLNLSTLNGKILYERCNAYSKLDSFNLPKYDTANFKYFEQANADLYLASQQTQFLEFLELRNRINFYPTNDIADIGILHANFYKLNYDENSIINSGLTFSSNKFNEIAGKSSFLNNDVMVISTLSNSLKTTTGNVEFRFANNLFLNNSPIIISSLNVDFGNGSQQNIIQNNQITNYSLTYSYTTSGYKTLTFNTSLANGTTITTYCRIYVNVSIPTTGARQIIDNFHFAAINGGNSDFKFQGYNETAPTFGQFDYRIFYHTNAGNTSKTLLRPLIIADGFDPGDKRKIQESDYINPQDYLDNGSIEEMMKYKDQNGNTQNLIDVLTDRGFDVIIVNYPTYVNEIGKKIDGGADYIERNGRTMGEFIKKINGDLINNSSAEKIVTVGPSMSGQVFRYALAFMEKYVFEHPSQIVYNHNCRLFISDDSPQQGATIPMGAQSFIYLASLSGDVDASDKYYNLLLSTAAKQQLIEIYDKNIPLSQTLNGKTIAQGYTEDRGHPFHIQYYTNLYTNGLQGSKGYPTQCRKIAVSNGSLSSLFFGNDGDIALESKAVLNVLSIPIEVFHFIINDLPAVGSGSKRIAYFHARKKSITIPFQTFSFWSPNINTRGNLDILPGGGKSMFDDFKKTFDNQIPFLEHSTLANQHFGCFIPTYSSLGIKNPDQNWGLPLNNRNLACIYGTSETYFDSYYGEAINTEHTTFSANCIDWLFKELGNPANGVLPISQAPWYPIDDIHITGPEKICTVNQNTTYTINGGVCRLPSQITWTYSQNITLISQSGNSVVVQANTTNAEEGTITANFQNGEKIEKSITINAPPSHPPLIFSYSTSAPNTPTTWFFQAPPYFGATYQWYNCPKFPAPPTKTNTTLIGATSSNILDNLIVPCGVQYYVCYKASNACGSSGFSDVQLTDVGYCKPIRGGTTTYDHPIKLHGTLFFRVQVATHSNEWFGHLFYNKVALADEAIIGINVYNKDGDLMKQLTNIDATQTDINFSDLPPGTYIFEIFGRNTFRELHTVYYSQLDQDGYQMDDIASGNISIDGDRAADRLYVLQQKLYDDLQSDSAAMEQSETLRTFAADKANGSFGKIYQMEAGLAIDDLATVDNTLKNWTPENAVDSNYQYYYKCYLKVSNNDSLNLEELNNLLTIASKCPLTDGEIIYAARDLYNYLVDSTISFTNACASIGLKTTHTTPVVNTQQQQILNNIYPNPSKGSITIDNLEYGTKNITVTNVYGKIIQQLSTRNKTAMLEIKIGAGIYFINITNAQTSKSRIQKVVVE